MYLFIVHVMLGQCNQNVLVYSDEQHSHLCSRARYYQRFSAWRELLESVLESLVSFVLYYSF